VAAAERGAGAAVVALAHGECPQGATGESEASSVSIMTTCVSCGTSFDVSDARDQYRSEFGGAADEGEYDEQFGGEVCANCAISETESNLNAGRAIMMMNGDEDYDEKHVERYL
jgi:hypothetical protein